MIGGETCGSHVTRDYFFLMIITLGCNLTVPCSLKSPRCHIIRSTVYLSRRFLRLLGSGDCDGFWSFSNGPWHAINFLNRRRQCWQFLWQQID